MHFPLLVGDFFQECFKDTLYVASVWCVTMLLEYPKRSGTSKEPVSFKEVFRNQASISIEGSTEYLDIPATARNCLLSKLPK